MLRHQITVRYAGSALDDGISNAVHRYVFPPVNVITFYRDNSCRVTVNLVSAWDREGWGCI
jgi:hypothetical protein